MYLLVSTCMYQTVWATLNVLLSADDIWHSQPACNTWAKPISRPHRWLFDFASAADAAVDTALPPQLSSCMRVRWTHIGRMHGLTHAVNISWYYNSRRLSGAADGETFEKFITTQIEGFNDCNTYPLLCERIIIHYSNKSVNPHISRTCDIELLYWWAEKQEYFIQLRSRNWKTEKYEMRWIMNRSMEWSRLKYNELIKSW
jgi:hypothetical protein